MLNDAAVHCNVHSGVTRLISFVQLLAWLLKAGLCCAVLCCAVLCCAVLCCAVLCCAVLCCAVRILVHRECQALLKGLHV